MKMSTPNLRTTTSNLRWIQWSSTRSPHIRTHNWPSPAPSVYGRRASNLSPLEEIGRATRILFTSETMPLPIWFRSLEMP